MYYLGVEPFFRQTVTDPNLFCCPCLDFLASRATRGKVGDRRIWSQVTSSTTPLGCCDEEPGVGVVIVRWPATKKGLVHYPWKMIQAIQTIGNLIHLCLGATNILIGFSWQRTGLAVSPRACCLHLHINLWRLGVSVCWWISHHFQEAQRLDLSEPFRTGLYEFIRGFLSPWGIPKSPWVFQYQNDLIWMIMG